MSSSSYRDEALRREAAKADFPIRQGYGREGTKFDVLSNNYAILTLPTKPFYHYDDITTAPSVPGVPPKPVPRRLYKNIMVNMMTKNPQLFKKRGSFDGNRNLYVCRSLDIEQGESKLVMVEAAAVDGEKNPRPQSEFIVKLTRVGIIEIENLTRLVLSGQQVVNPQGRKQALRNMSSAVMVLNSVVQMVGKNKYRDEANRKSTVYFQPDKQLGSGADWLELWQGYYQSVRPTINRMIVNIDVTHGLMFKKGNLMDMVLSHLRKKDARELVAAQITSIPRLARFLQGLLVVVERNQTTKTRPKPIVGIETRGARDYLFTNRSGDRISVAEYYRQTYRTTIKYPNIICVMVANKTTIVPLELCRIIPGQLYRGTVPPEVTQMVVRNAVQNPGVRLHAIKTAYQDLEYANSDFIRQCGMTIDANPLKLTGRRLVPPPLYFAKSDDPDSEAHIVTVSSDSSFSLQGKRFFSPATVQTCAVICFLGHRDKASTMRRYVPEFFQRLCDRLRALGLDGDGIAKDKKGAITFVEASVGGNVKEYVQKAMNRLGTEKNPIKPTLLIAIMPNPSENERIAIKRIGDVELGCATQILRTDKVVGQDLPKADYLSNVSAKINLKLGGYNWVLGKADMPGFVPATASVHARLPTSMIIGADVSHPPAHNTTSPSICGVVATLDERLIRYTGVTCVQMGGRRVELIHGLKDMLKPMFQQYRKRYDPIGKNDPKRVAKLAQAWPAQLIYYRDGVGESQLAEISDAERKAILDALRETQLELGEPEAPKPTLTFIVVSKRHHQRFFPVGAQKKNNVVKTADSSGNCCAGSVFDEGVASPILFDFYLQSQAAILGTARPAHYVVTHNDNPAFNCDHLQQFTFNLCHVYERAMRSVSIPAPVYYADLLCRRAKFMFPPDMDTDAASALSGPIDERALLNFYQSRYSQVHPFQRDKMYFV